MEKQSSPITPTQSILLRHPKADSPIKPHTQKTDTLGLEAGRNEVVLDLAILVHRTVDQKGYLVCCAHHNLSSSSCSTHNHKKYYSSLRVLHGNTLLPIRLRSTRHVWEHTNPLKPHRRTSLIKWHLTGMTYRKTMSLTLSYIIKPCSSEPNPTKSFTQKRTRPAFVRKS